MLYDLVVVIDFGAYRIGDRITDQALVAAITASEQFRFCVQVAQVGGADTTAPTITTAAAQTVAESAAFSLQLTASEAVTWTKTGGADAALFALTSTGLLTMVAKDFEAPTDANGDNAYVVTVTATDAAGNATAKTLTVTVTDVAEGGGATGGTGTLDFTDPANSGLAAVI